VETAFINHPTEAKLLRDPTFQTDLANQTRSACSII
jgi:N-acetylmuramoyl-L-alanine amidase